MKLINWDNWLKLLLSGGLLAILIQGLILIPEVRGRLFPGVFWTERLSQAQKECNKVGVQLLRLGGDLDTLGSSSKPQVSEVGDQSRGGWLLDVTKKVLYFPSPALEPAGANGKKQLYLARKSFVNVLRKLDYLEVLLENLNLAINLPPGVAALPANMDETLVRKQIQALRHRCQKYRKELTDFSLRLQASNDWSD